jgi:hypothetical protein
MPYKGLKNPSLGKPALTKEGTYEKCGKLPTGRQTMNHTVTFDKENGILRAQIIGGLDTEQSVQIMDLAQELLKNKPKHVLICDVSKSPFTVLDKPTRKVLKQRGLDLGWDRIAFIGADPTTKMMARIIVALWGKAKSTKFFASEKEAVDWLKEN